MPPVQLTLRNLHELDNGKCSTAVNHAIRQIMADIADRPADKAKRKVHFSIVATPRLSKDTGVLDGVDTQFIIKTSIPVRQTSVYPMNLDRDHIPNFQRHSPHDPNQNDLPWKEPQGEINKETGEVVGAEADDIQQI